MKKYIIGFANKHHTLWTMEVYLFKQAGKTTIQTTYEFIRNLGYDYDKVREKYPDLEFDESLRGKTASFNTVKYEYDDDVFHCGKYAGKKIAECSDESYLAWWFNNNAKESHKEIIMGMVENFQDYAFYKDSIISKQAFLENVNFEKDLEYFSNHVNEKSPIEFCPERNLDYDGIVAVNNVIKAKFPNFKLSEYNGYEYGLPYDSKNKVKRIKNKNILITDYSPEISEFGIIITVNDWTFC